jgi:peptidoglycan/xylan/chitin deacetylase (PgdA/CDA1 family)
MLNAKRQISKPLIKMVLFLVFGLLALEIFQQPTSALQKGVQTQKVVYLTFDDGPSPRYTPKVLDILRKEHVSATFFVLGFKAAQYPQLVRRIYHEGHELGNHGYYHTFIVNKSKQWVESDIRKTDVVVQAVCGAKPKYFRPPGGILSKADVGLVVKAGHSIAMWTVDTNDWKGLSAPVIVEAATQRVTANSVILMHDGLVTSQSTATALPVIIHKLRAKGYGFAVLPKQFQGPSLGGAPDSTNYRFKRS